MKHQALVQPSCACRSTTCKPYFLQGEAGTGSDGGNKVFLAVIDCDDAVAIARLREILPETAVISVSGADAPTAGIDPAKLAGQPALTGRQRDILHHLMQGRSNKEIGRIYGISHFTVRNHVSKLLQLFNVASRKELEAWAVSSGH